MKKRFTKICLILLLIFSCDDFHQPIDGKIDKVDNNKISDTLQCLESDESETEDQDVKKESINSIDNIINDMKLPHEGRLHGVPETYSWSLNPIMALGNEPGEFKALLAWGELFEALEGNPAINTRVQIRDIKAYMLKKSDDLWHLIQSSKHVSGQDFLEGEVGQPSRYPDYRYEEDGSVSVTAGGGYHFHFWNPERTLIDSEDIGGIFITVQARLIIDDPSKPDDRSIARYLLNAGGDYWLDLTAEWDYWKTNDGIAIGRFKYVTAEWQAFNMITLTEEEIKRNPPPLE